MEFSRQENWSGLPLPPPDDLPDPGIETGSPALEADSLLSEPPGKPNKDLKKKKSHQGRNRKSKEYFLTHENYTKFTTPRSYVNFYLYVATPIHCQVYGPSSVAELTIVARQGQNQ